MKPHILIADDEPAIRYTLAFMFNHTGYSVTQCEDGKEALQLLKKAENESTPYDLLLTDIQMPTMSGIELIQELKRQKISLPILVVSGVRDEEVMGKVLKNGSIDFLLKPYDLREVIRRVERLLDHGKRRPIRRYEQNRNEYMASLV